MSSFQRKIPFAVYVTMIALDLDMVALFLSWVETGGGRMARLKSGLKFALSGEGG